MERVSGEGVVFHLSNGSIVLLHEGDVVGSGVEPRRGASTGFVCPSTWTDC